MKEAVDVAFANRADLKSLEMLLLCGEKEILEAIQVAAKVIHPLIGLASKKTNFPLLQHWRGHQHPAG